MLNHAWRAGRQKPAHGIPRNPDRIFGREEGEDGGCPEGLGGEDCMVGGEAEGGGASGGDGGEKKG